MNDLSKYLTVVIKEFIFSQLDESFLFDNDLGCLAGAEVPIAREDLRAFAGGGLSTAKLADNMALVMGADINFKYNQNYIRFLKKLFNENISAVFDSQGDKFLKEGSNEKALCYFRAALAVDPNGIRPMYSYANACRYWYQSLEGEDCTDFISVLKNEAYNYFAQLTNIHPEFAPSWYYLGFAYLNAGAYTKANLAFKHYIDNSEGQPEEDIKEVKERMIELKDPMRLEDGKNLLIAGKTLDALRILEPYLNTEYNNWWPLHFYLATAYDILGNTKEAIEGYLKVLGLNPSNYDAMTALSELYFKAGDNEKAEKYRRKAEIVLENENDNN